MEVKCDFCDEVINIETKYKVAINPISNDKVYTLCTKNNCIYEVSKHLLTIIDIYPKNYKPSGHLNISTRYFYNGIDNIITFHKNNN